MAHQQLDELNPDDEMASIHDSETDEDDERELMNHGDHHVIATYNNNNPQLRSDDSGYHNEGGYDGVGAMPDDEDDMDNYEFSPLLDNDGDDDGEFNVMLDEDDDVESATSEKADEEFQKEVLVILEAKKYEQWMSLDQRQQFGGIIEPDVLGMIEVPPAYLKYGRWYTVTQSVIALLHCYALLLFTIDQVEPKLAIGLFIITTVALVIDIGLRIATYMPRRSKFGLAFDISTFAASIVVLYSTSSASYQLVFLALLRGVRVFRITYMFRELATFRDIVLVHKTVSQSLQSLSIVLIIAIVGVFITSTFIWATESGDFDYGANLYNRTCPVGSFCESPRSPFQSIPDAMWLSVNCMSLVGLGDTYPVTSMGRALAGAAIVLGVFTLALPTSILIGNLIAVRTTWFANESFRKQLVQQQAVEQLIARTIKASGGSGALASMSAYSDESLPQLASPPPEGADVEITKAKKVPEFGSFQFMGIQMRPVREGLHGDYLYDPIMQIINDKDGFPLIGNITTITGNSTCVTVYLCIDDPLAREIATDSVKANDAVVHCSSVSSLQVDIVSPDGSVVLYRNPSAAITLECYVPLLFLVAESAENINLIRENLAGTELIVKYCDRPICSMTWQKTFFLTNEHLRESRFMSTLKEISVAVSPYIFNSSDMDAEQANMDDEVLKKRRSVAFIHPDHIPELFESIDEFFDLPAQTTIRNAYEAVQDIATLIISHSREIFAKDIPPLLAKSVYDADHVTLDDRLVEVDLDFFCTSDWPLGSVTVVLVPLTTLKEVQVRVGDGDSSEGPQPVMFQRETINVNYSLAFDSGDHH